VALFGFPSSCVPIPEDLSDNPQAYIDSAPYRRGILERDLRETSSAYAVDRLNSYGRAGLPWDLLPEWDPPSRPVRPSDLDVFVGGGFPPWGADPALGLVPEDLPTTTAEWVALGRRVFFEYPLRLDPVSAAIVQIEGALETTGFLQQDEGFVGLRIFEQDSGQLAVGNTCAQCHAGRDPDGGITGILANKDMDIGAIRLLTMGLSPGELPPELESSAEGDLNRLGPGRGDVQADGTFNPFAFPDLGGIADMPLLHHNANWSQGGVATMAVRCETLFITASGRRHRIPRVLSWALAEYYHSLPPPPPEFSGGDIPEGAARGAELFDAEGCADCHVPPLYSSDQPIAASQLGTDSAATDSQVRGTGFYRVASLRGVAWTAPYLHHGVVASLEDMLDAARLEEHPGHEFGQQIQQQDKEDLIRFLRTL
jgi:mono/diheme cytochrome c family protein